MKDIVQQVCLQQGGCKGVQKRYSTQGSRKHRCAGHSEALLPRPAAVCPVQYTHSPRDRIGVVTALQTALSDGSYAHSMHLVVRAASVGGAPSTSATPKPAVQAGSSAGTSSGGTAQPAAAATAPTSQEVIAGQAPAAVAQAVETAPSFDSHRSDPSSAGGSSAGGSSSGQHEEGTSDGGGMPVGPGAMPHFGAPAGLSPMFVFGTHGSSNGLLYTGDYCASVLRLVVPSKQG